MSVLDYLHYTRMPLSLSSASKWIFLLRPLGPNDIASGSSWILENARKESPLHKEEHMAQCLGLLLERCDDSEGPRLSICP